MYVASCNSRLINDAKVREKKEEENRTRKGATAGVRYVGYGIW